MSEIRDAATHSMGADDLYQDIVREIREWQDDTRTERRAEVNLRICELRKQRDAINTEIEELISEWSRLR